MKKSLAILMTLPMLLLTSCGETNDIWNKKLSYYGNSTCWENQVETDSGKVGIEKFVTDNFDKMDWANASPSIGTPSSFADVKKAVDDYNTKTIKEKFSKWTFTFSKQEEAKCTFNDGTTDKVYTVTHEEGYVNYDLKDGDNKVYSLSPTSLINGKISKVLVEYYEEVLFGTASISAGAKVSVPYKETIAGAKYIEFEYYALWGN